MAYGSAPVMTLPPDVDPTAVSAPTLAPVPAPAPEAAPIKVTGPDGQVFNFPSDTPEPVMKTALLKHYQSGEGKGWEEKAKAAEVAASDAPTAGQPGDASAAIGQHLISDIPVIGRPVMGLLNKGIAAVRSIKNDVPYSKELANVEGFEGKTTEAHPIASAAGGLASGVIATAPLMAAAPAAFGLGAGSLAARTGAAALSGGALGGADAAVRSGGDLGEIKQGALIGGALGGAGPGVGRVIGNVANAVTGGAPGMNLLREAIAHVPPEVLDQAAAFRGQSPTPLTLGEAIQKVSEGAHGGRVAQIERVVGNSGGKGAQQMADFYAKRLGQTNEVAQGALDAIGERTTSPTNLGFEAQAGAQAGVAQTPEGMALRGARDAAPPVSAFQVGSAEQTAQAAREARLVEAQKAASDPLYEAGKRSQPNVGMDGPTVPTEVDGQPFVRQIHDGAPLFDPATAPPRVADLAPTRAPVEQAQGPSLTRHIAEGGGIGWESGDLKAAGLDRWNQPGVGKLLRDTGEAPSIDGHWRANLIEHGYLPPDPGGSAGMQRNVHDEIINLLEREQAGQPVHPYWWDGSGDARAARQTLPAAQSEFQNAAEMAQGQLHEGLTQAGYHPDNFHPDVLDRATGAMIQNQGLHPLDALERSLNAVQERGPASAVETPRVKGETVAPQWVQADPRPALAAGERQLLTAKGDVRSTVQSLMRDLYGPDGRLDGSVEGMLHARERADMAIATAREAGDNTKVRDLTIFRHALDRQVKQVPEIAAADAAFAQHARGLDPYRGNGALAQVTRREGNDAAGRFMLAAEDVPGVLQRPTALRETLANDAGGTRERMGRFLHTQLLDGTEGAGSRGAATIRERMAQHQDALAQMPEVRDRVNNVALAHEGMARVEASPLGLVAKQPEVKAVTSTLFARVPDAGSEGEIGAAMSALSRNRPRVAEQLVRFHLENLWNAATTEKRGLPAQYGAAAFASFVRGGSQQARNFEAAVRALPDGHARWTGLSRVLDAFEATGYRPQKGSDTAFNQAIQKELASGKTPLGQAFSNALTGAGAGMMAGGMKGALAGGVVGLKHGLSDAMTHARMMKNGEAMARLITDPAAIPDLRALAKAPAGSRSAELFTARLIARANTSTAALRAPAQEHRTVH